MVATRPTRSFLSSRKEERARLHRASGSWKGGPRISADLVNRPQDFPLGFRGSHFSSRDFVCRTECHSTLERGSRLVKTRLLFRSPQISDPIRRTGLPSRLPSRSMAGYIGYTPNLHRARMEAMSKSQPAESGKES